MKIIPKVVFQLMGIIMLCWAIGMPIYWGVMDAGLYRVMRDFIDFLPKSDLLNVLAFFLAMLICLLPVVLVTVILRHYTIGLGTIQDEIDAMKDIREGDFSKIEEQSKNMNRPLGVLMLVLGIMLLAFTWWIIQDSGKVYIILPVSGVVLTALAVYQLITGKLPKKP